MAALSPLQVAALRLRNASPQAFNDYVTEIQNEANALLLGVANAAPSDVLVCQGRAQHAMSHLYKLKECTLERVYKLKECTLERGEKPAPK